MHILLPQISFPSLTCLSTFRSLPGVICSNFMQLVLFGYRKIYPNQYVRTKYFLEAIGLSLKKIKDWNFLIVFSVYYLIFSTIGCLLLYFREKSIDRYLSESLIFSYVHQSYNTKFSVSQKLHFIAVYFRIYIP
jgi:hypothetical protein